MGVEKAGKMAWTFAGSVSKNGNRLHQCVRASFGDIAGIMPACLQSLGGCREQRFGQWRVAKSPVRLMAVDDSMLGVRLLIVLEDKADRLTMRQRY